MTPGSESGSRGPALGPVLVTGGSGFVAACLVAQLLERGYRVNATVRDLTNDAKVAPLRALQSRHAGALELFSADLLAEGSFGDAIAGCVTVFHVASPFKLPEKIGDGQAEMVEPALRGTQNVLRSVEAEPSVSTVVLTSTVGAIFGDYADVLEMDDHVLAERYWNTTSTVLNNPYHYAKTLAEQEAWRTVSAQGRWRLVTINPGLVLGPTLTPASQSGSLFLLDELLKGYFFYGAPNLSFTVADVRDVARAHIEAAERPGASGRYIVAHEEMYSFRQMSQIIRPIHHRKYLMPTWQVPDAAVRLLGPRFGLTQDFISKHLGIRFRVDNARGVSELGITYRPVEETLRDHYRSWAETR